MSEPKVDTIWTRDNEPPMGDLLRTVFARIIVTLDDYESDIKTQQAHIDSFRELCEWIVSFGHPATSCVWDRSQIERIYERAEQFLEITNPSQ